MKIKICGMRDRENIVAVSALDIDFMGFIFYKKSPRFIDASWNYNILNYIPNYIKKVAVMVHPSLEYTLEIIEKGAFDFVQLHGEESPKFIENLKAMKNIGVIKAFSIDKEFSFDQVKEYDKLCDYFLFDTKTDNYGGSGRQFDWDILDSYHGNTPFFLSGGIGLNQIEAIAAINHPMFYGIDANSQLEEQPAMKNIIKVDHFIKEIKKLK